MRFRVASYNIHRCYGSNGRHDPAQVREVLRQIKAQVIALQEVELLHDNPDLLEYFCEDSDWSPIPGLTLSRDTGHYGNALLTALPVIDVDRFDISISGREPRGAISVMLRHEDKTIHVIDTHLGLNPGERRYQVQRLLEIIEEQEAKHPSCAITLMMGDFNEWFLWGRPLRWLHEHFLRIPTPATFPAICPFLKLDRIWIKPRHCLATLMAWKTGPARTASDHLPLSADIECAGD